MDEGKVGRVGRCRGREEWGGEVGDKNRCEGEGGGLC